MNKVKSFSKLLALVLISASLLQSCSKKISVFSRSTAAKNLKIEGLKFDYLTIKSKVTFKEPHKTTNATALIRMKKDSVIWFNLTGALGVQGVRGIVTQDSVKILNKVEKKYFAYDFKQVSKEFDFQIDFDLIQAILVGDMPKPLTDKSNVRTNSKRFIVKQNMENYYITNYIGRENLKLEEVNVTEKDTDNSLKLLYKNFRSLGDQGIPYSIFAALIHHNEFGELETQLTIDHVRVETSDKPIKFPFTVPKKYEVQ